MKKIIGIALVCAQVTMYGSEAAPKKVEKIEPQYFWVNPNAFDVTVHQGAQRADPRIDSNKRVVPANSMIPMVIVKVTAFWMFNVRPVGQRDKLNRVDVKKAKQDTCYIIQPDFKVVSKSKAEYEASEEGKAMLKRILEAQQKKDDGKTLVALNGKEAPKQEEKKGEAEESDEVKKLKARIRELEAQAAPKS